MKNYLYANFHCLNPIRAIKHLWSLTILLHRSGTARGFKTPRASHRLTQLSSKRHSLTSNSAQNHTLFRVLKIVKFLPSSAIVHFHLRWAFTAVLWWTAVRFVCRHVSGLLENLSGSFSCVFSWGKGRWFTIPNPECDFDWEMSLRIKCLILPNR